MEFQYRGLKGTPEQVAQCPQSYTGHYLQKCLTE